MKITIERILVVLLVALLLILHTCNRKNLKEKDTQITALQLEKQTLDSMVNASGQTILQQQSIVTSSQTAIQELTDSIFDLKKSQDRKIREVIAYYKGITVTKVDSVLVPYVDSGYIKKFGDSIAKGCNEVIKYLIDSTIHVPQQFSSISPDLRISGTVNKQGVLIDSLQIPDTLQLRFIERKGGLFKRRSVEIQFFHSSPYIQTTSSNSVIYQPPKKKRILEKALLIGLGVFLGTKL